MGSCLAGDTQILATREVVGFPDHWQSISKDEEVSLILRHLLLLCGDIGLISATFYKACAAVSSLTDIFIQTAVQFRGGLRGLQVDITFNGLWQWPLRDGQQRGSWRRGAGGRASEGRSLTPALDWKSPGFTIGAVLVEVFHLR